MLFGAVAKSAGISRAACVEILAHRALEGLEREVKGLEKAMEVRKGQGKNRIVWDLRRRSACFYGRLLMAMRYVLFCTSGGPVAQLCGRNARLRKRDGNVDALHVA